ncbi:peptide chain release factor N(5)-glutamine methyltransferase [Candidatus Saccharibacteria bacterium]|nr:peptide chain release factor N(5)-glutamine methyltransferase [Candidatus Saccharibacteria bacterium]
MRTELWLDYSTRSLETAGISSARLDSLILLEDCLDKDRAHILAHPEMIISTTRLKKLNYRLKKRLKHEPMAYIRGYSEFYGRKFKINKHVLEPRPESEVMISMLKKLHLSENTVIADVGTGSGCLGITATLETRCTKIDLYDIDASALAVAKHNSVMHEVGLKAYKRNLLNNNVRPYDIVMANLPYVPNKYKINKAAKREPKLAIFGGADGLDIYRKLFEQVLNLSRKPSYILTESMPPQHSPLASIAKNSGYKLRITNQLIQVFEPV